MSTTIVNTRLNYFLEVDNGGSNVAYPGTAGDKLRKYEAVEKVVTDMRSCSGSFTLDKNGFQLVQHHSLEKRFDDEARVKDLVYDETSELLKTVTGATKAVPFSHIIRRQSFQHSIDLAKKAKEMDIIRSMNPAMFCHVDQSYNGALQVLRDNLSPPEAEKLAKSRWGIINVWRPIERPVLREPLAVCDSRSVDEGDLRPVMAMLPQKGQGTFDEVSKGNGFEIWHLAKNERHRWYYASKM